MVYRSTRIYAQKTGDQEGIVLQDVKFSDDINDAHRLVGRWRTVAFVALLVCACLFVAVILLLIADEKESFEVPVCGKGKKAPNHNVIDKTQPVNPGPFHDLTTFELRQVRRFLENDPNIKAVKAEGSTVFQSSVASVELFPAPKKDVLKYLDQGGPQPPRQAHVVMHRGDKQPPVVEEYVCGPLPEVTSCDMHKSSKRRNPIEFSVRVMGTKEFATIFKHVFVPLDQKIGHILQEQYGTSYTSCKKKKSCFSTYPSPVGTNITGNMTKRQIWLSANYQVEFFVLNPVDFGVLVSMEGSDPSKWGYSAIWFRGNLFQSADELLTWYNTTKPLRTVFKPEKPEELITSLHTRGHMLPEQPQRPPMLVEPDGRRYSLKAKKITYLGWEFNVRMSALRGPQVLDVRYRGERIVYEMGLAEIAVYYSAGDPVRLTEFVDSNVIIGTMSKSLVPGVDCPETANYIPTVFMAEQKTEPVLVERSFCVFENNNGHPLRRHLSYLQRDGAFFGGMMDSALILRSILTVSNYDYVLDLIFHQNGVIENRVMSTGYILPAFFSALEEPYAFQLDKDTAGIVHHHMFHFKVDLDIHGTSNRYETLDIMPHKIKLRINGKEYHQTRFKRNLKRTEKEAVYDYNFDHPKYHVVHNDAKKSKYGEMKAYRLLMKGASKQLTPEGTGNEGTIAWARHQLVVTKQKDDELVSSSPYAMWDSLNPVTNFTTFYEDNENITDEDLVFWISQGMHHIPHTEDITLTPTVGNHLEFFLMPNNYFTECPSASSRDNIRIQHKNPEDPKEGVRVLRNGNSKDVCSTPPVAQKLEDKLEKNPDFFLESRDGYALF